MHTHLTVCMHVTHQCACTLKHDLMRSSAELLLFACTLNWVPLVGKVQSSFAGHTGQQPHAAPLAGPCRRWRGASAPRSSSGRPSDPHVPCEPSARSRAGGPIKGSGINRAYLSGSLASLGVVNLVLSVSYPSTTCFSNDPDSQP